MFNDRADELLREWMRREEAPDRSAESPNAWFKREAYRMIKFYLEEGLLETVERNFTEYNRPKRLVTEVLRNPFKFGLLAMFSDETGLSKNHRKVFGDQMLYAWLHDVPPPFLNAFLGVSGGPAIIAKKLKSGAIEPGFEDWYKPERYIAHVRGRTPDDQLSDI